MREALGPAAMVRGNQAVRIRRPLVALDPLARTVRDVRDAGRVLDVGAG